MDKDITKKEQHNKIECIGKENNDLKQRFKDNKCDIEKLEYENYELEVKNEKLESENIILITQ